MQLVWGHDGIFLATERKANYVHVFSEGTWREVDLGTGPIADVALSPDGKLLAITTRGGSVCVFDWSSLEDRNRFFPEPEVIPKPKWSRQNGKHVCGVELSMDSKRLFVGHVWPLVGIYEWRTGKLVYAIQGGLHFQQKFIVGPQNQLAASLLLGDHRVYDNKGRTRSKLPYPIGWGSFGANGRLLVTEYEGLG